MSSAFRFDPPRAEVTAELSWALRRAFGPGPNSIRNDLHINEDEAVRAAKRYGLAARIGSRTPRSVLFEEVGEEGERAIHDAHMAVGARAVVVEQVFRELAEAADVAEAAVVFLKGAALWVTGSAAAGSRALADIDLLVTSGDAEQFAEELETRRFNRADTLGGDHDLLLFAHDSGLMIDVHRWIPLLEIGDRGPATAETLLTEDLCVRLPDFAGQCCVPNREVLIAHALVHGLAQHGLAPDKYPLFRLVADIQDLAPGDAEWAGFLEHGFGWIEGSVTVREVAAVRDLERLLALGRDPTEIAEGSGDTALLLHHVIAGATDENYRLAIRARHRMTTATGASSLEKGGRLIRNGLFLTRPQIDHIYGQPRSAAGYWGWRLWRPFDLIGRACRYAWAWVRHRYGR